MALLTPARVASAATALAALLACAPATAQAPEHEAEHRIKAAFVYHFGTFVEWPAHAFTTPDEPLVIGVVADDGIAAELQRIAERRPVQGRAVRVVRLADREELLASHIVFISHDGLRHLPRVRELVGGRPTLLVTEADGHAADGTMIDFVVDGDRVRFDVDLDVVHAHGLRLSSRMLDVARRVTGGR